MRNRIEGATVALDVVAACDPMVPPTGWAPSHGEHGP